MRLSCNGCRVLRKGCGDACTIRPCLQWINSPDAQANATVFLAKFYGRAGLLNLLAAAPDDALRPAVFRSLLYEACGRVVNPVYGAVGLLWEGACWHMCQAAVEAVLKGAPIVQASAAAGPPTAPAPYDIRHVFLCKPTSSSSKHRSGLSKPKFKRTSSSKKTKTPTTFPQNKQPHDLASASPACTETEEHHDDDGMLVAQPQQQRHAAVVRQLASNGNGNGNGNGNAKSRRASPDDCDRHSASASLDTEEAASHVTQAVAEAEPQQDDQQAEAEQQPPPSMGLDLTLGLLTSSSAPPTPAGCRQGGGGGGGSSAAVDEPAGVIAFRFL